ncbi:hypothetical protein MUP01_07225 [Candidatus Bathyarchaeota archaeon]|nr:hypothetical protein [Candidatus Bathyarchaeota archaeon]
MEGSKRFENVSKLLPVISKNPAPEEIRRTGHRSRCNTIGRRIAKFQSNLMNSHKSDFSQNSVNCSFGKNKMKDQVPDSIDDEPSRCIRWFCYSYYLYESRFLLQ